MNQAQIRDGLDKFLGIIRVDVFDDVTGTPELLKGVVGVVCPFVPKGKAVDPTRATVLDDQGILFASKALGGLALGDQVIGGDDSAKNGRDGSLAGTSPPARFALHLSPLTCTAPSIFGQVRHEVSEAERLTFEVARAIVTGRRFRRRGKTRGRVPGAIRGKARVAFRDTGLSPNLTAPAPAALIALLGRPASHIATLGWDMARRTAWRWEPATHIASPASPPTAAGAALVPDAK